MNSVEVKSFANADEINDNFNNAKIEACTCRNGQRAIMKLSLNKCSVDMESLQSR